MCANDLLESVSGVNRRVLEEIARTVLTPEARQLVLKAAEEEMCGSLGRVDGTAKELRKALTRVDREIENLLRAVETGAAPATLLERLQERERERAGIEAELRAAMSTRTATQLDAHRMRRVLEDGLSRLSDVLYADTSATRRAPRRSWPRR